MPVIATNMAAISAGMQLNRNSREQSNSLAKLSSGSRIVRASDDAAGLAVSTALQSDITTLKQAARNIQQGIAVLQIADAAFAIAEDLSTRMKSLAVQARSGSIDSQSYAFIQQEGDQLYQEGYALRQTSFNNLFLVFTTYNQEFQVGTDATDTIDLNLSAVDITNFLRTPVLYLKQNMPSFQTTVDAALTSQRNNRAILGSYMSRFQARGDIVETAIESLEAAKSSISDVDIGTEQINLTNSQVLSQSSTAAFAQASKMPLDLLKLIK